ncbi:hypothetical protein BGZ80_002606 [Entomortierella chlamydospora]|uniref:Uncharacterized protein n=1 Tax=Entomortierella chlamydospora TaxID=101097 RepID=A0A9P6MPM1_9FUNG|nr:hypothetical protein BGZ80_002606 [Entomortierella chlamydospora]
MTDKEIEEIELDILKYNYTADYDPTYDVAMDMEMSDMEQTIEHYMRLETSYAAVPQEDFELASAMSLSMTIISSVNGVLEEYKSSLTKTQACYWFVHNAIFLGEMGGTIQLGGPDRQEGPEIKESDLSEN